jgi:hypothetical protein
MSFCTHTFVSTAKAGISTQLSAHRKRVEFMIFSRQTGDFCLFTEP